MRKPYGPGDKVYVYPYTYPMDFREYIEGSEKACFVWDRRSARLRYAFLNELSTTLDWKDMSWRGEKK
jgi:hypothetical protein